MGYVEVAGGVMLLFVTVDVDVDGELRAHVQSGEAVIGGGRPERLIVVQKEPMHRQEEESIF